jgi:hypothetical protein
MRRREKTNEESLIQAKICALQEELDVYLTAIERLEAEAILEEVKRRRGGNQ